MQNQTFHHKQMTGYNVWCQLERMLIFNNGAFHTLHDSQIYILG
jgi:hypothetical protein